MSGTFEQSSNRFWGTPSLVAQCFSIGSAWPSNHEAILQTTVDMVVQSGFRAVSVEAIAASLGVSKATIYRRWPNKAAMVMEAFTFKVGSGRSSQNPQPRGEHT